LANDRPRGAFGEEQSLVRGTRDQSMEVSICEAKFELRGKIKMLDYIFLEFGGKEEELAW
jgi:hypothetical protein